MARECIPDAVGLTAPGLEIRGIGQQAPSEGGESAQSVALTLLSNKRLDGVPVAQKITANKFRYLDRAGKEITKEEAMKAAEGVVYYQDATDPSKGRLRHRGTFINEDDARSHVSSSRASCCSDIANPRDLEFHDLLTSLTEEDESTEDCYEAQTDTKVIEHIYAKRNFGLARWCILSFILICAAPVLLRPEPAQENSTALVSKDLHPELSQLLIKNGGNHCGTGQTKCSADTTGQSVVAWVGSKFSQLWLSFLDGSVQDSIDELPVEKLKELAAVEINRILASSSVREILGDGNQKEQRRSYHRIARLLHPDKGLVSSDDQRASLALRLASAARD